MPDYKGISRGYRLIGEKRKFYRSKWEANYARWLQYQLEQGWIQSWQHEPRTFWFSGIRRGTVSFLPDFQVSTNDLAYWVEIKGYMDAKSATKIKRFKKFYPEERLVVIDREWFKKNNEKMKLIIKDWE